MNNLNAIKAINKLTQTIRYIKRVYNIDCDFGDNDLDFDDEFELEGFTKEVCNCSDGWTEIIFKLGVDK